ncbi:UNVERIFIED_CONTAM: hypothetical protein FKN15_019946 [Acipenser sinensis]
MVAACVGAPRDPKMDFKELIAMIMKNTAAQEEQTKKMEEQTKRGGAAAARAQRGGAAAGEDLCPLRHPPVPRPTLRSALSARWGPMSPVRGPFLAAPEGLTHPQARPWMRAAMDIAGLESGIHTHTAEEDACLPAYLCPPLSLPDAQDYTTTIFLRQRWTDNRLLFEGNKSLSLDGRLVELLWVPDTFIVDSKKSFLHDITVENRLIRIFSNGTVLYALRITATIACNMDLTKYPMDRQVCTLQLESWGYNLQDVVFYWTRGNDSVKGLDTLQLAQYSVESYYTSVSQAVYETGFYPKLVLHFALRRNILYFILETYVPSTLLVALSWVSFWISQSSVPARTCIGVTTVLTMTTLMMGARTSLPNANCFIKAIDVYLGICFSFIFGALLDKVVKRNNTQKDCVRVVTPGEVGSKAELGLGNGQFFVALKGKVQRILAFFHVENPHNIDRYSRMFFPLAFMLINVFYWIYYLFL